MPEFYLNCESVAEISQFLAFVSRGRQQLNSDVPLTEIARATMWLSR